MSLAIIDIKLCEPDDWDELWHACPWATFSESREWSELWRKTYGETHTPNAHMVHFTDGMKLLLPTTFVSRTRGWVFVHQMSPSGGYGGPIGKTLPSREHLFLLLERVHADFPDFHLKLNPFLFAELLSEKEVSVPELLPKPIIADFTQPVPLNEDLESLLTAKRVRRYANAARKKGYSVKRMPAVQIADYLKVYADAQSRWDETTVRYPDNFFHNMYNMPGCTFYGVYNSEDEFCGGGPFLFSKNIATSWLSFMKSNTLQDHIYELFYHDLLLKFRDEGYTWFDFNPSGGQTGVVRFKQKFTPYRLPSLMYESYSWKRLFLITMGRK